MKNPSFARTGFVSLLLAASGFLITGCSSLDDRYESSIAAAGDTDAGYASLDSALAASITRLDLLSKNPGTPLTYIADVNAVRAPLKAAAEKLADARAGLASGAEKQLVAMQEAATQLPPDAAKDLAAKAGALRVAHTDFDKAASAVAEDLDKGLVALNDVVVATGANATPAVVKLTGASLDRAAGAFREARSAIADAKSALKALQAKQPKPTAS